MTINVGLVTSDALIFGCDSVGSATRKLIDPFKAGFALAGNNRPMQDKDGNLLVAVKPENFEDVVWDVLPGIRKMFQIHDCGNGTVVAATTAGLAKLCGRTIGSLADEYAARASSRSQPFVNVSAVANDFMRFMSRKYEEHHRETKVPRQYWDDLYFLVGGIGRDDDMGSLYRIMVKDRVVDGQFEAGTHGIAWAGQAESVERIIRGYDSRLRYSIESKLRQVLDSHHTKVNERVVEIIEKILDHLEADIPDDLDVQLPGQPSADLSWEASTLDIDYANLPLQYAVDFVSFLVMTQAGPQRFSRGIATVGGRTHVGVIEKGRPFRMLDEQTIELRHTGFSDEF